MINIFSSNNFKSYADINKMTKNKNIPTDPIAMNSDPDGLVDILLSNYK
jgi:hypothetical protein